MRRRNWFPTLLGAVALALWSPTGVYAQALATPPPYELTWLGMTPGQVFHLDGYELTEAFDAESGQRRDYIRAPGEDRPREFYHHGRGIAVALVSQCKMLVVEDGYTTKLTRLAAIDLPTMKQTEVATNVAQTYRLQTGANVGNFVHAKGVAISPDCRKLLVSANATYLNAQSAGEAAIESLRFPKQWYVVSLGSGKVSVEFSSAQRPSAWY